MSDPVSHDLRLVLLAALAWLYEHDVGHHAEGMDAEIDKAELAGAIDRISEDVVRAETWIATIVGTTEAEGDR